MPISLGSSVDENKETQQHKGDALGETNLQRVTMRKERIGGRTPK